jgi:hypothetical protein
MNIIKCHICRLNAKTCEQICVDTDDVTSLYKEGLTESDSFPKGFCTNHKCEHNPSGLQCVLENCIFGLDKVN